MLGRRWPINKRKFTTPSFAGLVITDPVLLEVEVKLCLPFAGVAGKHRTIIKRFRSDPFADILGKIEPAIKRV